MGFDGSLRPKQPRPYSQPPPSTVGIASNGNQAYNRAVGPPTHRAVPSMSGSPGVSRTYLNSSSYVTAGNTTVTQMVSQAAASTPGADSLQQLPIPPPPTNRPLSAYDMPPPEEPSKKMEIEVIKEVNKKEPSLAERVTSLKANGVGFDVDFVIGATSNTAHFEVHRIVMAAGSKILERMLFSEAESSSPMIKKRKGHLNCPVVTIYFSDVDPVAFQTIIDYIYSDFDETAIKIAESAVLNTLYAAKKFEIAALEKHCVELLGELTPSLAVALLEQAVNFGSEELLERCHQVIDERSDEALSSDSLANISIDTLKKLVKRSELSPSGELSVFRAVCNWATAECKRRGIDETSENKRLVVDDVLNDVRFPTMTVEELGEAANSGLLSDLEIGILFRYVTSTVHVGIDLPYPTHERRILSRSRYVVRRFMNLNKNTCKKQRSTIWFIVNREILVTALGIYGLVQNDTNAEGSEWETTVDVEVAASGQTKATDFASATLKGTYGDGRAFIAHFKKPARVVANVPYRATVIFKEEVETFAGGNGQEDILVYVGSGGAVEQNYTGTTPAVDQSSVAVFAFHNDDPNGIRRGMTRGPAVYTDAIGGFYNRPINNVAPVYSEGCLYEGQIPEIHFMAPMEVKKEISDI
ncbi:BTB/POZ domain family protein [Acanthocheilonema viteae]